MRQYKYLKAIVIVHGKSEKQICQFIKQKLRFRLEIVSDKHGEKSIQITSLNKFLNNSQFKTQAAFFRYFPDVEFDKEGKCISPNFKIFIIMDIDDCNNNQKDMFINKDMFKGHWSYNYIVPIYNDPELETVLTKANIPFTKHGDKRKQEYIKLFPTSVKYEKNDTVQIEELRDNLKSISSTNLEEFLNFCLNNS